MELPVRAQQISDARQPAHLMQAGAGLPRQVAPLQGVTPQQLSYPGGVTPCAQPAELST